MTVAIETRALKKEYKVGGDQVVTAVNGIDLAVTEGEIYALLGPNGAGKTTTISMLTTLLRPSSGSALVAGYDVVRDSAQVRRRIGVTFQETVLDKELTGRRILDFHGRLYGLGRSERSETIDSLAELVELSDALDRKVETYSGGMKRRLELARGLMTRPRILFLDEPTQGLDPHNRAGIWRYIRQLRDEQGITLLLTTHYMEEAEALADAVGIIDHGDLIAEGSPGQLIRQMGADVVALIGHGDAGAFVSAATALPFVTNVMDHSVVGELFVALSAEPEDQTEEHRLVQIGVDAGDRRLVEVVQLAEKEGFHVQEVSVAKPSLGDVFLAHTGHALRD